MHPEAIQALFPGPESGRRPSAPPVRPLPPRRGTTSTTPAPTRRILRAHHPQPLAAQSAGRVVYFAPLIDAAHWPTMRIRPVPPICHRNCIAIAPFIYPHYLLRPLSRLSVRYRRRPVAPPLRNLPALPICTVYLYRLAANLLRRSCADYLLSQRAALCPACLRRLSLPPGCADHAEAAGTDYLRRLSAPCYLRRTVCRGALSIVSGLSSSSSSSRISATRSSVISPSV